MLKYYKFFSCCVFILYSFQVRAETCSNVEVDQSNMPKNNYQEDLEWCFAFSSANLFSFYLKKPVSSYHLALLHHLHPDISPLVKKTDISMAIGSVQKTLFLAANAQSTGLCLEENTLTELGHWQKSSQFYQKLVNSDLTLKHLYCDNKISDQSLVASSQLLKILDKLSKGHRAKAFLEVTCKKGAVPERLKEANFTYMDIRNYSADQLVTKINQKLNSKEPVSVSYQIENLLGSEPVKNILRLHASTVVGRQFNPMTKKCEFLVKDSFNKKNCSNDNSKIRCVGDGAYYFISEEQLKKSLYVVESLDF